MDTTIKCLLTSIRFWHLLHLLPRVHAWGYEVGALHYAYSHRCWKKEMEICRSINTQTPQNIRGKELSNCEESSHYTRLISITLAQKKAKSEIKNFQESPREIYWHSKLPSWYMPDTRTIFTEFPSKNCFQLLESINSMLLRIFEAIS